MWWFLTITFFLISLISSVLLYFSLRRINQYENLILQFQQIVTFSSEKMKQVDARGHYESDDETGFFFKQIKDLQNLLNDLFEIEQTKNLTGEDTNAKKEK
tara:strand:- start:407 stop:709 length:303 start_codon:yes stop_codon:yes gene_type:complete